MIYRKQIRTIKNATETTLESSTVSANPLAFNLTTSDYFYLGWHRKFATRYFNLATANTNPSNVSVHYFTGSIWASVDDLVDQTLGFTQSGFISWLNESAWEKSYQPPVTDKEHFWIRISVSSNLSAGTSLQSVNNLYCDNSMLRALYPELVSDSRYLPPGRTNFLEQFQAAKDLTVLRLKQLKAIRDEADILDITEVSIAATHAAAYLILQPIARSDEDRERAKDCYEAFNKELNSSTHSFDYDETGTITENEEDVPVIFRPRI